MKVFSLILFTAMVTAAQSYVGLDLGVSGNGGLTNPTPGVVAGYRSERFVSEFELLRLCKKDGGCGHEVVARGVARYRKFQGGVVYSSYQVVKYGKSSLHVLAGVNLGSVELNYRHDLTSENKMRRIEMRYTKFASHHIFVRFGADVSRFRDFYHKPRYMVADGIQIGFWK
jgi:hypothetical protein